MEKETLSFHGKIRNKQKHPTPCSTEPLQIRPGDVKRGRTWSRCPRSGGWWGGSVPLADVSSVGSRCSANPTVTLPPPTLPRTFAQAQLPHKGVPFGTGDAFGWFVGSVSLAGWLVRDQLTCCCCPTVHLTYSGGDEPFATEKHKNNPNIPNRVHLWDSSSVVIQRDGEYGFS